MTDIRRLPATSLSPGVPYRRLAATVLMIGALTDMIDVSIVNVALPTIRRELGASTTELQWIVSGYMLAFAATLAVAGSLGDLFGRRRLFVAGSALFGAASLAAGLAGSPELLIGARVAQGLGAATMTPQVLATFRAIFPREERGTVFGIYGAVLGLAAAAGVTLGGVLVDPAALGWGWRSVFLVNLPIVVIAIVGAVLVVPETSDRAARRPDLAGAGLLVVATTAIVYPLLEGRRHGWPGWGFALLAAGLATFGVVVARGLQGSSAVAPILPGRLLRAPAAVAGLAAQLLFSAGLQGLMVAFVLFLQVGQHATPLRSGLTLLGFSAGGMLGAPPAARLAERHGRVVLVAGAALLASGVGLVVLGARYLGSGPGPWPLLPGLVVAGAGLGLLVVPLVNVVLAAVPRSAAGGAAGLFATAQQLGGALGVAVIGSVFFAHSGGRPDRGAFDAAALAAAIAFALSGLLSLALPRTALAEDDAIELAA